MARSSTSLKRNEVVRIDDVREDARTREAASALEARSAAIVRERAVVEQGRLVAVLYVNHAQVRCWSDRGHRLRAPRSPSAPARRWSA
jgi:hypothetical protein